MSWSLVRSAIVSLDRRPLESVVEATIGGATLSSVAPPKLDGKPLGTLVTATVPLTEPPEFVARVWDAASVDEERRRAEAAIETVTRLLAVDQHKRHGISSPRHHVGLVCEDLEAVRAGDSVEVVGLVGGARQSGSGRAGLFDNNLFDSLVDRPDGVALLAEALNSGTAFGQYTQLVRLFERAFKLGPWDIRGPLAECLHGSRHRFADSEVEAWTSARAPAFHADRREEFLLEADVRPYTPRMMEAGYDVLLNKETWRNASPARRDIWQAASGSDGTGPDIFVVQGREAVLQVQVNDDVDVYPLLLAGGSEHLLPTGLWVEGRDRRHVLAFKEHVP